MLSQFYHDKDRQSFVKNKSNMTAGFDYVRFSLTNSRQGCWRNKDCKRKVFHWQTFSHRTGFQHNPQNTIEYQILDPLV